MARQTAEPTTHRLHRKGKAEGRWVEEDREVAGVDERWEAEEGHEVEEAEDRWAGEEGDRWEEVADRG